jgi:hypothetical protein
MYKWTAALCLAASLTPVMAWAQVSDRDLQVAGRTFGFVDGMPQGDVAVAVVYDPAAPGSKAEADAIAALMGNGLKVAKNTLKPKLVPVSALDLSGTKVAYVTAGLAGHHDAIFTAASGAKAMTITKDFACVDAKKCVMGFASEPAVKIQISRSAASSTGLAFSPALKLMVTESE